MFVPGIPTPTELHGLIGMDQFRRRHLATPLCMEAMHIQDYMQWSPLAMPDIKFTVQMINTHYPLSIMTPRLIKTSWNRNFYVFCQMSNCNVCHRYTTDGIVENTSTKFSKGTAMLCPTKYPMGR